MTLFGGISSNELNAISLKTLSAIFTQTVVGAENMKESEFEDFPIQALTQLSQEILEYNGLAAKDDKGGELGKKN